MVLEMDVHDVFLQPGEIHFGGANTRIRTVLGSCVALSVWHPVKRLGGLSHCLLPSSGRRGATEDFDGHYVDEAVPWLMREMARCGTRAEDYEIKLFGGGNMFRRTGAANYADIGRKNVEMTDLLLKSLGLSTHVRDVGGEVSRSLIFEVATGDVWVRRGVAESVTPADGAIAA